VTPLIVVILAVAWVVVLVPPLLRSRSDGRPSTSIGSFRQQLATLSRTGPPRRGVRPAGYQPAAHFRGGVSGYPPRLASVPRYERPMPVGYSMRSGRADVRRRRLNVLVALLAVAVVTAIGGFGVGISAMVGLNLLVDAVLVFYVYLLVQLRRAEEERAMRDAWSKAA
jgi:hypothetical protein